MKQETEQEMLTVSEPTVSRSTNDRDDDCHELSNLSRLISFDKMGGCLIAPCKHSQNLEPKAHNPKPARGRAALVTHNAI